MLSLQNKPSQFAKPCEVPLSKSINNRLQMLAFQCQELDQLSVSSSGDSQLLYSILTRFNPAVNIDVRDAGTVARFVMALCAATPGRIFQLSGTERMHQRPMHTLIALLREQGARIICTEQEGYLPVKIQGAKLHGGTITFKEVASSQFISALLLVANNFSHPSRIQLPNNVGSLPYIHMTLQLLNACGLKSQFAQNTISIEPQRFSKSITWNKHNEGDWSSASFLALLGLLQKDRPIQIRGLTKQSIQGDAVMLQLVSALGGQVEEQHNQLFFVRHLDLPASFEYDFRHCPDLAIPMACFCVAKKIPFHLSGLASLELKESKRITALHTLFHQMGHHAEYTAESLTVNAFDTHDVWHFALNTYDDHRIAMGLFLCLHENPKFSLMNHEVVGKSFPGFWEQLALLGFSFELSH